MSPHRPEPWRGSCLGICTCDRPSSLRQLLEEVARQPPAQAMTVLILDNGGRSAAEVASEFTGALDIHYEQVEEPGLTPVRNRAIEIARDRGSRYLVFVDDDEVPDPGWLDALLACAEATGADLVGGTVRPLFELPPPPWIEEGGFFENPGNRIGTHNVLLRMSSLPEAPGEWFLDEFRESGGEDYEFLRRLVRDGARAEVTTEAVVREHVPPERARLGYLLRNALRDGVCRAQVILLNEPSAPRVLAAATRMVVAKVAYAASHVALALAAAVTLRGVRWRLVCALRDLITAAGCLLRLCGLRFRFYGRGA